MTAQRPSATYLAGWVIAALAAMALVAWPSDVSSFDPLTAVTVIAVITTAELVVVYIRLGRAVAAFTLSEAAIVAGLLLVDPSYVVLGAAAATLLGHLPRRLSADKILFNVSQVIVCTAAAGVAATSLPPVGPRVAEGRLIAAIVAMLVYATLNTLAFRSLIGRVAGPDGRRSIDEQAPLTLASMFGTVAVGIVAAHLWVTQPILIVLLFAPLLAIQIAARSSLRADMLVSSLRAERDRLEQVVLGASDGILLLDGEAHVQIWSPALERWTGIRSAEAVGRPVDRLLTDDRRRAKDVVRGRWIMADDTTRRTRIDAQWQAPGEDVRDVQEEHALLYDTRGACNGDVVLIRDVSRERSLERLRGDFIARVSHELRTPLTPIRGYVHLLLHRSDRMSAEQRQDALQRVLDRTDHLGELIEDLLLVTQLERGHVDAIIDVAAHRLDEVVTTAVSEITGHFDGRPIVSEIDPGTLPAMADPVRVRQVITELLDNAARYSPRDRAIRVALEGDDRHVRINVTDEGPGIPPADEERIFERFQRLGDPLTMQTTGLGVGLYIARQLTIAMHGSLDVSPNPRGGAIFTVTLPAATPMEGDTTDIRRVPVDGQ